MKQNSKPSFETAKWVIVLSFVFPVLFILVYSFFQPGDCASFKAASLKGFVTAMYRDSSNHNVWTLSLNQTEPISDEKWVLGAGDSVLVSRLEVHDFLEKPAGCNFYILNHSDTIEYVCTDD